MGKPILCLDFDGVLHSYTSGWQGPRTIPDPPVDGALEWLADAVDHFRVSIFSSRSHYFGGRRAMKRWLRLHYRKLASNYKTTPGWMRRVVNKLSPPFADLWQDDVRWATRKLVGQIAFPRHKPPALLAIDDRAMCFDGVFPSVEEIRAFRPWNKR